MTTITVPIRIKSLNKILRHHWAKRYRSNTTHQLAVYTLLRQARAHRTLPCIVTLTRVAPRQIDEHDNLQGGFKDAVDAVALWLDTNDANPLIEWRYGQRKGGPHEYAAEVTIEPRSSNEQ